VSALIKASAALGVRPLHARPAAQAVAEAPAEDPRIGSLAAEVEALRAELAEAREEAREAAAEALEDGRREGRIAARRDDERRIELLASGVAEARARWENELVGLEDLAALLSRNALAKLFVRDELYADFVAAMVARQIEQLRRDSVLAIHVSSADFPDEASLAAFSGAVGAGPLRVEATEELEPGECRIDLQLGHVDVGPRTQWPALSALLETMAAEGAAA
jgi:flagellar biosynthesis/type III secretory pathway protein FliH